MLTVTLCERAPGGADPLAETRLHWSVVLAVAQWRRSAPVTSAAREALRALRVPEDEIEAQRRATSSDPCLAALLTLAVTHVIAGGALLPADLQRVQSLGLAARVPDILASVAHALDAIAVARRDQHEPIAPIDLDIGDY
jgi:hypothetical protein